MVLALRYLHKEKGIVHRDLSPNNVMLGENDKVTISKSKDFFFFLNIFFYYIHLITIYYPQIKLIKNKFKKNNSKDMTIIQSECNYR